MAGVVARGRKGCVEREVESGVGVVVERLKSRDSSCSLGLQSFAGPGSGRRLAIDDARATRGAHQLRPWPRHLRRGGLPAHARAAVVDVQRSAKGGEALTTNWSEALR